MCTTRQAMTAAAVTPAAAAPHARALVVNHRGGPSKTRPQDSHQISDQTSRAARQGEKTVPKAPASVPETETPGAVAVLMDDDCKDIQPGE